MTEAPLGVGPSTYAKASPFAKATGDKSADKHILTAPLGVRAQILRFTIIVGKPDTPWGQYPPFTLFSIGANRGVVSHLLTFCVRTPNKVTKRDMTTLSARLSFSRANYIDLFFTTGSPL